MTTEKKLEVMRFSSGKMNFWSQISKDALVEIMRVYHIGGIKYDEGNWLRGMKFSEMANPLERHWFLWSLGDTKDRETRCHHLAHVAWNALGLLTYELRGLGLDDRIKLPIDFDFSWLSGPAKELDLGLSKEELDDLSTKYNKQKEEFRAEKGMAAPKPSGEKFQEWMDSVAANIAHMKESVLIDEVLIDEVPPFTGKDEYLRKTMVDVWKKYGNAPTSGDHIMMSFWAHTGLTRGSHFDQFVAFLPKYTTEALSLCQDAGIAVDITAFKQTLEDLS